VATVPACSAERQIADIRQDAEESLSQPRLAVLLFAVYYQKDCNPLSSALIVISTPIARTAILE